MLYAGDDALCSAPYACGCGGYALFMEFSEVSEVLEVLEAMRRVLLCMLEGAAGDALCATLYALEGVEGRL